MHQTAYYSGHGGNCHDTGVRFCRILYGKFVYRLIVALGIQLIFKLAGKDLHLRWIDPFKIIVLKLPLLQLLIGLLRRNDIHKIIICITAQMIVNFSDCAVLCITAQKCSVCHKRTVYMLVN